MSFKRDQSDKRQLDVLRKRRIADLLSVEIPEDEARLLCNGRLACLVCRHRPVFDTVNMLTVHRQGNKHGSNAACFYEQKQELCELVRKRRLEEISKYGVTNIKEPIAPERFLGSAVPYDSRVKKLKPTDRKPKLDLKTNLDHTNSGKEYLPAHRHHTQMIAQQSLGPVLHPNHLSKIFENSQQRGAIQIKPYCRKRDQTETSIEKEKSSHSVKETSDNFSLSRDRKDLGKIHNIPSSCVRRKSKNQPNVCKDSEISIDEQIAVDIVEKAAKAERYLNLRGAGWKKDWNGKWIRDEDAEFDSDEEIPDLP
ncbi:hypothetical protein ScPMuIL_016145 [Solemya velum]